MSLPAFAASGAGAAGSGAGGIVVNYPAGVHDPANPALVVLWADWKYGAVAATMSAPGFTSPPGNQATGGAGGTGIDAGDVTVAAFYRVLDGTEGASVTVTPSAATSVGVFQMHRFTKLAGETWAVTATSGPSNTPGLAFSALMAADPGITTDDLIVGIGTVNTDTPTRTAEAVAAAGVTFGAVAELNDGGNGIGDDIGFWVSTHPCTSGVSAGAPTYTATNSAGVPAGAAVLLRLRASAPAVVAGAGSGSSTESTTFVFSPPPRSAGLTYTMHERVTPTPPAVRPADLARQFGRDIKLQNDTEVGPDGRYLLVQDTRALRQAVYNCLRTEPGSLRRFPSYGVGLLRYIGRTITQARTDEIKNRLQEGLLQLRRVDSVSEVAIDQPDPYTLRVHVKITAAGRLVRFQPFDFRRE